MNLKNPNNYANIKQKMKNKEQRQKGKEYIFKSKKTKKKK